MIRGVPLTGDHFRSVNRFEVGTPLHRQVADAIRRAIIDGTLVAGETLPGEHTIAEMAGVARATVRTAMDDLVAEGRIVKRSGCPTRVVTPPQVRRMSTQRLLLMRRALTRSRRPSSGRSAQHRPWRRDCRWALC